MTDDTTAQESEPAAESVPATPEQTTPPVPETTEPVQAEEQETKPEEPESPETETKRLSRTQRQQRKIARLSTIIADQQARIDDYERRVKSTDAEPKEADFNGDIFAYQGAKASYDARKAVREEFIEKEKRDLARDSQRRSEEAAQEFFDRVEEIKPRIPDFDDAIASFYRAGGKFEPHVQEEVRDSDKGPALAYHLAKHPELAAELNALSPRDAAREIGRLEMSLSLPQPKKQTQARAPISTPSGGASASKTIAQLAAQDDLRAYVEARNKEDAKR